MAFQERREGVTESFPKIPKEIVDNFIKTVWQRLNPQLKHEIAARIEASDPHLEQMIEEITLGFPEDAEGVRVGAYLMFEALARLEQKLSSISSEVAETLRQEYISFVIPPDPVSSFMQEENTGNELTNPLLDPYPPKKILH